MSRENRFLLRACGKVSPTRLVNRVSHLAASMVSKAKAAAGGPAVHSFNRGKIAVAATLGVLAAG